MTQPTKPSPRLSPEQIAVATELLTAYGEYPDVAMRNLCESYLRGEATFFGVHMHESNMAHDNIVRLMTNVGIDVDAMQCHYYTLCDMMQREYEGDWS